MLKDIAEKQLNNVFIIRPESEAQSKVIMTTLICQTFAIYQNLKMLEFLTLLDILAETNLL